MPPLIISGLIQLRMFTFVKICIAQKIVAEHGVNPLGRLVRLQHHFRLKHTLPL